MDAREAIRFLEEYPRGSGTPERKREAIAALRKLVPKRYEVEACDLLAPMRTMYYVRNTETRAVVTVEKVSTREAAERIAAIYEEFA